MGRAAHAAYKSQIERFVRPSRGLPALPPPPQRAAQLNPGYAEAEANFRAARALRAAVSATRANGAPCVRRLITKALQHSDRYFRLGWAHFRV